MSSFQQRIENVDFWNNLDTFEAIWANREFSRKIQLGHFEAFIVFMQKIKKLFPRKQ